MAVNKNFVVKNGLEVDTNLIFADASTNKVGIGSTIPQVKLDVLGGIGASELNISGVGTIVTLRSTTGIITTVDAISVQATNTNITGVSSISTAKIEVGIITNVQGNNANFSGILTAASVGSGFGIGIGSTGGVVGYGFTNINFIGVGNTFKTEGRSIDISISGGGGSGNVSISSAAPSSPNSGDLWYSTEYGRTFVWFDEEALGIGNTSVWVDAAPFNAGGKFVSRYGDNVNGAIGYTGGTTSQASIYYTSDPNTGIYFPSTDHVGVVAGGTASLVVNPNGVTVTGILTGNGSGLTGVASTDNIVTGTAVTITNNVSITGVTTLGTSNSGSLNVVGMTTLTGATLNGDVQFTGDNYNAFWDKSVDSLQFADNAKATFGDHAGAGDLQIYHNGSHSFISNTTGQLNLRCDTTVHISDDDGYDHLKATKDGDVELYYDGSKRFETASDAEGGGVIVTGKIVGTAATIGTGVTVNNTGIDMGIGAGICTAKEFYGDGSNLTGLAAGGGEFNTGISEYATYAVTTSMAAAFTSNASATHRTIIHSCRVTNISSSEVTVSGELYGTSVHRKFAYLIPVPAGSSVELLKKPKVLGSSQTVELQCSANSALQATIAAERQENTALQGAAIDSTTTSVADLFTLTAAAVVESILCANDDGTNDVKATVSWTDGSDSVQAYLSYEMIIPAQASVELLENPLAMPSGHKIRVTANQADRLCTIAAYKLAS